MQHLLMQWRRRYQVWVGGWFLGVCRHAKQKKKDFFFEKKKQKTFIC